MGNLAQIALLELAGELNWEITVQSQGDTNTYYPDGSIGRGRVNRGGVGVPVEGTDHDVLSTADSVVIRANGDTVSMNPHSFAAVAGDFLRLRDELESATSRHAELLPTPSGEHVGLFAVAHLDHPRSKAELVPGFEPEWMVVRCPQCASAGKDFFRIGRARWTVPVCEHGPYEWHHPLSGEVYALPCPLCFHADSVASESRPSRRKGMFNRVDDESGTPQWIEAPRSSP